MSTHYRQQFNFTFDGLEAAKNAIDRLTNFMYRLKDANGKGCEKEINGLMKRVQKDFGDAMDDDLNVGVALAALFEFVREVNNLVDGNLLSNEEARQVYELVSGFDTVLAVLGDLNKEEKLPEEAQKLIQRREEARKARDWKTADQLRIQLKAIGVITEDTPQGPRWRIQKR
jgi:cysteinyl-tRNA synthetase